MIHLLIYLNYQTVTGNATYKTCKFLLYMNVSLRTVEKLLFEMSLEESEAAFKLLWYRILSGTKSGQTNEERRLNISSVQMLVSLALFKTTMKLVMVSPLNVKHTYRIVKLTNEKNKDDGKSTMWLFERFLQKTK